MPLMLDYATPITAWIYCNGTRRKNKYRRKLYIPEEEQEKIRKAIDDMLPDEESLHKLSNLVNKHFNGFEFPKGFIKSKINNNGDLILSIGWRDLHLDKDANFIECGTDIETINKSSITEV